MAIIYTLLGIPYVAVLDPVRGVVLQKAARKRKPSPGQMSLFAGNEPKEGDTKVENGVTYRLNQNSRWERTDKAKGKDKTKAKAVVPVVEEEREEPTPEDLPQPTIGDMLAEQKTEEEAGGVAGKEGEENKPDETSRTIELKSYPKLNGSEKQIAWAEKIRSKIIEDLGKQLDHDKERLTVHLAKNPPKPKVIERYKTRIPKADLFLQNIAQQNQAAWWIDNEKSIYDYWYEDVMVD